MADDTFDIFLSHNSKDKPVVRQIAEALRGRGLRVWLDEWELVPGRRWIPALEKALKTSQTVAVMVSENGFGRWEQPEYEGALSEFVKRGLPVIPVLLPGAPEKPELPLFLTGFTWVDLRGGPTEEGLDRLEWGITGKKPNREKKDPGSSAPRLHNLPFLPLGDLLKGRDEALQRLITNLRSSAQATAITQAIHGLGGIGKTRLAVEYAWRSGDRYDTVLFVVADSPEALRSGLASLARPSLLNLPEYEALRSGTANLAPPGFLDPPKNEMGAEAKAVEAVLSWLRDHSRWLLILDNIDTEEAAKALRKMLPRFGNGHVLITSRRRVWPPTIRKQPLCELTWDEAALFLLRRTEGERTPATDDAEQVGRLAEILGGLPLALEQAAAYIVYHQTTFAGYLEEWERERDKVLEWHDQTVIDYPVSVAATWQATFQRLSLKAAALLRLAAFLAPEPIPETLFEKGDAVVEGAVRSLRKETGRDVDKRSIRDTLAELSSYSMVTRVAGTLTVHRLVQEVLRFRIPNGLLREWTEWSVILVNYYWPSLTHEDLWPLRDALRPHASELLRHAGAAQVGRAAGQLITNLESHLFSKGLYKESELLLREAWAIEEKTFGPHSIRASHILNSLGACLMYLGEYQEAETLLRRSLQIMEIHFEPQDRNSSLIICNLARLLTRMGRLTEAESLAQQALYIAEKFYGHQHPEVLEPIVILARVLHAKGYLEKAERLTRRSLQIKENFPGSLAFLGELLWAMNRHSEALTAMQQAADLSEAALGPDHHFTRWSQEKLQSMLAEMDSQEPKN